jgi:hypothetical protein
MIKNYTEKCYFFVFAYILIYLVKRHHVSDKLNYLLVDVCFLEVPAQDQEQKLVMVASQLLKINMVALQKLKKAKVEPNGVAKLEVSLKNKRTGVLNMDI